MYLWDSPPSASIHEEATVSTTVPFMAVFNNLVLYDQHKKLNTMDTIQPELATSWAWDDDQDQAHLQAAQRREMARRQAVHGQGRRLHPGQAAGEGHGQLPQEPAQDLVAQPEGGDRQRRPRGDVPPRPAASVLRRAVRHRLQPGLSLPRVGGRHAHQADRHRSLQVRRVQEQRVGQARAQPRLLAQGPPLPRCHRMARHLQPLDPRAGLRRRRVRHDVLARPDRGAGEGHPVAAAEGDLRAAADQQLDQPDRQPRRRAVQRPEDPHRRWRCRSTARPSSISSARARPRSAAS